MAKPIVALMYDFDKTLSPKNMQDYGFMKGLDVTSEEFWSACTKLTKAHQMDSILSYMYMMLEKGHGKYMLKRESFRELGKSVKLFPGVQTWFGRINEYCESKGLKCEHYIISSGLTEIIRGSAIGNHFKAIFAASFCYDGDGVDRGGLMPRVASCGPNIALCADDGSFAEIAGVAVGDSVTITMKRKGRGMPANERTDRATYGEG